MEEPGVESFGKRLDDLEVRADVHERAIFGGVDHDGERTVSVLERLESMAVSVKSIETSITAGRQMLQRIAAATIKIAVRAAWVIGTGFLFGVWQLATHWDTIGRAISVALHELTKGSS